MENWEKVTEAAKQIGIEKYGISQYGFYKGVNVRISDHLPSLKWLNAYAETLTENENGEIDLLISTISDDDQDQECFQNQIEEELSDETGKKVNVFIHVENTGFYLNYFEMLIRTKF